MEEGMEGGMGEGMEGGRRSGVLPLRRLQVAPAASVVATPSAADDALDDALSPVDADAVANGPHQVTSGTPPRHHRMAACLAARRHRADISGNKLSVW